MRHTTAEAKAGLLSNRYFFVKVSTLVVLIFLACLYCGFSYHDLTLAECLAAPDQYDGATLKLGADSKVGALYSDRFELHKGNLTIPVIGTNPGLEPQVHVDLIATFHKEGYLKLIAVYVRKYRDVKIAVSILPVFIVAWLMWKHYTFDRRHMVLVEKKNA